MGQEKLSLCTLYCPVCPISHIKEGISPQDHMLVIGETGKKSWGPCKESRISLKPTERKEDRKVKETDQCVTAAQAHTHC